MIHFGNRLKRVMEAQGVRQIDLARLMDTRPQNIARIFNKENFGTEILVKASEVLKVPLSSFMTDTDYPKTVRSGKATVVLELNDDDVLNIDIKNRRLEIVKK